MGKRREEPSSSSEDEEDVKVLVAQQKKRRIARKNIIKETIYNPRINATYASHAGRVFIFGGEWTDGEVTRYPEETLIMLEKGMWYTVDYGVGPTPRSACHGVVKDGSLWVYGGEIGSSRESSFVQFGEFWRLDLTTLTWKQLEAKNGPGPRSGHRMALFDNRIVLFGGYRDNGKQLTYLDDFWSFDGTKWERLAAGPGPRSACHLATHGTDLYLFGGFTVQTLSPDGKPLNDLWRFRAGRWESICSSNTPIARSSASSFSIDGNLFLFGGVIEEGKHSKPLSDLSVLELPRCNWKKLADGFTLPRLNAGLLLIDNSLFIFGGLYETRDESVVLDDILRISLDELKAEVIRGLTVELPEIEESEEESSSSESED